MSSLDHSSFLRSLQARMRVRGAEQLSEQTQNQQERTQHSSVNVFQHTNEETAKNKYMSIPSMGHYKSAPAQTSSFVYDRRLFQLARGQEVDITCGDSTLGSYTITPFHNKSSQQYNKQSDNINNSNNSCRSKRQESQELNHVQNVTSSNTNYNNVGDNNEMRKLKQSRKVQTTKNLARADANANYKAHVSLQSNLPLDLRQHKENNEHINKPLQTNLVSHSNNNNNQKEDNQNSKYSLRGSRYTIFPFKQQDVIDSITERYCTQPEYNCDNNNNFDSDTNEEKKVSFAYVQSNSSNNNCFDHNKTNEGVESRNHVVALTHPCNNTTLHAPPIIIHYHFANQANSQSDNDDNASAPLYEEKYITTKSSSPSWNVSNETAGNITHAKIMNEDQAISNTSTSATLGQLETSHNTPRSISVHPASSPTAISTMEPLPPSSAQVELTSTMSTNINTNMHKTEDTNNTTIPNQGINSTEGKQHEQKENKNSITSTFLPNTNVNINTKEDFDHSVAKGGNFTINTNNSNNDNEKNGNKKSEQTSLTSEQEREAMLLRNASRYVQSLEHKIDAQMSSFESHIQLLNEESARNALLRKDRDSLLKLAQRLQSEKAQLQHWLMSHEIPGYNLHYNIQDDDTNSNLHNKKQSMKNRNVQEEATHFIATPSATNTSYRNLQSKDTGRRKQNDKHAGLNFSSYNSANSTLSSSSSSSSSSQVLQDHKPAKVAECDYSTNKKCNKKSDTANLHKSTTLPNYTVTAQSEKVQVPLPNAVRAIYESTMEEKLTCANAQDNQPEEMPSQHAQENKIYEEQKHEQKVQQQETHKEVGDNIRANPSSKVTLSAELSENIKQNTEKHNAIDIAIANFNNNKKNDTNGKNNKKKMPYDETSVTRAKQRLSELEKYVDQLWSEAQMTNESRSQEFYNEQLNHANHNFDYRVGNINSYKHVMPHSVLPATATAPVHEVMMTNRASTNRNSNELHNNTEGINTSAKSSAFRDDVSPNRYEYTAHVTPHKMANGTMNDNNTNRKYKHFAEVQQLLTEITHERAVIKRETEQ